MPRQRASNASAFRERKLPMAEKTELLEEDEKIVEIELERWRGFENHPFKVRADSQMIELQESIRKYGILNPLIVRPKKDGCYEIISGHRRKFATEKIGYRKVPVIIRVLKDDEAVVSMVDSNLQREMISPSEKAFAYKMKYEAIKRKAGRRKCGQVDHNLGKKSIELIGEECGDSPKQVHRYIKITDLIPEMLEKVDDVMLKIWEQLISQNEELFSDCGPFCMNGGCEEGKMTCGKYIPPKMSPTDIIRVDFPKLCEETILEEETDEDSTD